MGFIKDLTDRRSPGRALWDRAFGTNKEEARKPSTPQQNPSSVLGSNLALARLINALRSRVPGNWSDDRYEQSRHFSGIPYIAIHRTGLQLMQAEFQIYHKDPQHPDGKRPVVEGEPEYEAVELFERPNKKDSFGLLMYRLNQQLGLTGTALTWIIPNAFAEGDPQQRIVEMYSLPTALAQPIPVMTPDFPEGGYYMQPIYPNGPYSSYPAPISAAGARIPAQWVVPVQYPHPLLWYDGYSPLTALRLQIDEVESIDRSRWYSQFREISPSAVLNFEGGKETQTAPLPEEEIERIRAEMENDHQGPENHGRLLVSTPGAKLEPWGTTPDKMMYESGWEQLTGFVLGAMGITKPAAGMVDGSSYATLFAALKQLHTLTLDPICSMIAGIFTRRILPYFGDHLLMEIRCKRVDDHDITNTKIDKLIQLKGMPASVIRTALEMLEIPAEDKMVEDLSKAGQEGAPGGIPGMGMPGQVPGQAPPAPEPPPLGETDLEEGEEPPPDEAAMANSAPTPGKLGEGSLGPRKSYNRLNGKTKHLGNGTLLENLHNPAPQTITQPIFNLNAQINLPKELINPPAITNKVMLSKDLINVVPPPAVVNNYAAPPRTTKKQIEYNAHGWPVQIIEEEQKTASE